MSMVVFRISAYSCSERGFSEVFLVVFRVFAIEVVYTVQYSDYHQKFENHSQTSSITTNTCASLSVRFTIDNAIYVTNIWQWWLGSKASPFHPQKYKSFSWPLISNIIIFPAILNIYISMGCLVLVWKWVAGTCWMAPATSTLIRRARNAYNVALFPAQSSIQWEHKHIYMNNIIDAVYGGILWWKSVHKPRITCTMNISGMLASEQRAQLNGDVMWIHTIIHDVRYLHGMMKRWTNRNDVQWQ